VSQIFHIFRKDVRRHWPEILFTLILLVVFGCMQPRVWTGQPFSSRYLQVLLNFLPALIVISWIFLIVRLVQSETLVGDRQFWITRPYEWPKLLAAKLLSILLFVHFPLFLAQIILLMVGRFPVMSSIPGLLFIHFLFVLALVLPSLTIGSITSGIGQGTLAILAVFLCILGIVLLSTVVPDMDFATDATDGIQAFIYLTAACSAIFLQYAFRKSLLSRLIVAGGVVLIILVIALAPYKTLIARDYPLSTQATPLPAHLALDRSLSFAHAQGQKSSAYGDDVQLEIPFQITGLSDKTVAQIRAIKFDLELPGGEIWSSHWQSLYHVISFGRTHDWPNLSMKKSVFNRIKDTPIRAHVTLGFRVFQLGAANKVSLSGDRLILPGGSWCMNDMSENWFRCFSALKQPQPQIIMAELPNADCAISQQSIAEGLAKTPALFSVLTTDTSADLGFTPIKQFDIALTRYFIFEDHQIRLPVCPGTTLFISKPQFLYAVRDEIDMGEITLMNYLPTYPRRIVPPHERLEPGTPSNSLSWNFAPSVPLAGQPPADAPRPN
jgi:hypothetical protein